MSNFPITKHGFVKMQAELDNLKTKERPAVINSIAQAREHGDLKENAEYHAAREKQSFIEGRILDLEDKLARSQIVDPQKINDDIVRFAAIVTLFDLELDKEIIYQIVSEYEADIEHNLISLTSPIAKSLLGKKAGEGVEVKTPKGIKEYEIIKIEYR